MAKKEVTLGDVHGLMGEFMTFTKKQFDRVDKRLDENYSLSVLVHGHMVSLHKEIKDLKESAEQVAHSVKTLQEDTEAIGRTLSKDSLTLRSYGKRLLTLERSKK